MLTSGREVETRQDKAGQDRTRKDKRSKIWHLLAPRARQFQGGPWAIAPYLHVIPKTHRELWINIAYGRYVEKEAPLEGGGFCGNFASRLAHFKSISHRPISIVRVLRFPRALFVFLCRETELVTPFHSPSGKWGGVIFSARYLLSLYSLSAICCPGERW